MSKKINFYVLVVLSLLFLPSIQKVNASEFNFSVETIIPENQINNNVSYFDLLLSPSEEQTIYVLLKNETENEVIVETLVASATTNQNGVVEFSPRDVDRDLTLIYALEEIIDIENEILLLPYSQYLLPVEIIMPSDEFKGLIVGGITFREKIVDVGENDEDNGMTIRNLFEFVVGVVLQNDELASFEIIPDLKLLDVFASQINLRNVIVAHVQNIKPNFLRAMEIEAIIHKDGESDVLYELHIFSEQLWRMAPNSNIEIPIKLNGAALSPGEYVIDLTIKSKHKINHEKEDYLEWNWLEKFEISKEDAIHYNENAVDIEEETSRISIVTLILLFLILLIIILLIVLIFLLKKFKKNEDKTTE